jgi:malic enzyme
MREGPEERLARANRPAAEALRLHPFYRGKLQVLRKCAIRGLEGFSVWYSPGVAARVAAAAGLAAQDDRVALPSVGWEVLRAGAARSMRAAGDAVARLIIAAPPGP